MLITPWHLGSAEYLPVSVLTCFNLLLPPLLLWPQILPGAVLPLPWYGFRSKTAFCCNRSLVPTGWASSGPFTFMVTVLPRWDRPRPRPLSRPASSHGALRGFHRQMAAASLFNMIDFKSGRFKGRISIRKRHWWEFEGLQTEEIIQWESFFITAQNKCKVRVLNVLLVLK